MKVVSLPCGGSNIELTEKEVTEACRQLINKHLLVPTGFYLEPLRKDQICGATFISRRAPRMGIRTVEVGQ